MPVLQVEICAGRNQPVIQGHSRSASHQEVICKMTAKGLFPCPPHTRTIWLAVV